MASSGGAGAGRTAAAAAATDDGTQRQLLELAAQRLLAGEACKATPSSNYDYVKVKIRLGSQLEHYYILSRFLLSRMLTVITLPQHKVAPGGGAWGACLPAAAAAPAAFASTQQCLWPVAGAPTCPASLSHSTLGARRPQPPRTPPCPAATPRRCASRWM